MDIQRILSELKAERDRLVRAIQALELGGRAAAGVKRRGRPAGVKNNGRGGLTHPRDASGFPR
jgi:hypothetical protein